MDAVAAIGMGMQGSLEDQLTRYVIFIPPSDGTKSFSIFRRFTFSGDTYIVPSLSNFQNVLQ